MIRKQVCLMLCISFSIAILAACAKTTEIVPLPPPQTATQVSATKTLPPPTDTPPKPTQTYETSPTVSSIKEMPMTERVSVASDGTQGNGGSYSPAISVDGRYTAFQSDATNLVEGDTNGVGDIFVHDRKTGETERATVDSDGTQGNGDSYSPAISADGRYVVFQSNATNLVELDTNWAIFVHDRVTGETALVSVSSDGTQGNFDSADTAISADGRYVVFSSGATNLVAGDTNGVLDSFVHDRVTGETTLVSVASDGTQGNGLNTDSIAISADGRYVAFRSDSRNLVEDDTNWKYDCFVHDRMTGETTRVSIASDGTQGNGDSDSPAISADGRYVAFHSGATNLVEADTNGVVDSFVHDRVTGETTLVSISSHGTQGNGASIFPAISEDGRYVAFMSFSDKLVEGDTNGVMDVFVHDRVTGETMLVSVYGDPILAIFSTGLAISPDGRYVAFRSGATNLVEGDTNGVTDIFVRDFGTSKSEVITPVNAHQVTQLDRTGFFEVNSGSIISVAFSPHGDILAAGYSDGPVVRLYDVMTLKLLAELKTQVCFISSVAFSPDGKLIAAGGFGYIEGRCKSGIQIWDVVTKEQRLLLDDFNYSVNSLAFNPDGTLLATGEGDGMSLQGSAKIWNVATGELLDNFGISWWDVNPSAFYAVFDEAFNPNGTLLATENSSGEVLLWDVAKHMVNKVLTPPTCYGRSLAISPDGKLLAKSWCPDTTEGKVDLQLWDIAIGEILLTIEGHEPEYNSLDISPNGQILVSAGYGTVRLWDVETGKALMVLDVPNVSSVTFSPDGTLLATDGDIVRLWGIPAH